MHELDVAAAYDSLAGPYVELFGDVALQDSRDVALVEAWRDSTSGALLDAGCGPGHWTDLLAHGGRTVVGLDLARVFLEGASVRFKAPTFVAGSLTRLPVQPGSLGGVLAWYSLIHLSPDVLPLTLAGFAEALMDGGSLLLGFFDGPSGTAFEHKVTTAWFWSAESMAGLLADAGLVVNHVERRDEAGARPHGAMTAVVKR